MGKWELFINSGPRVAGRSELMKIRQTQTGTRGRARGRRSEVDLSSGLDHHEHVELRFRFCRVFKYICSNNVM
jgi:hypothetical protein